MHNRVKSQRLDRICVRVRVLLAQLPRPHRNGLVAGARRDVEAVAAAAHGIDVVAVGLLRLENSSIIGVKNDEALADGSNHERAIGLERNVPNCLLPAVLLGLQRKDTLLRLPGIKNEKPLAYRAFRPRHESSHFVATNGDRTRRCKNHPLLQ